MCFSLFFFPACVRAVQRAFGPSEQRRSRPVRQVVARRRPVVLVIDPRRRPRHLIAAAVVPHAEEVLLHPRRLLHRGDELRGAAHDGAAAAPAAEELGLDLLRVLLRTRRLRGDR